MNKLSVFLFSFVVLSTGFFSACNDMKDDYSTNPNHRLSFSVDTLSFDTVFTTIGSATRRFMVYNTNKEVLLIESIRLQNTEKSGFRFNIDGRAGESFSNIRIMGKDSLFVFVEVTVNPTGHNEPFLQEDRMEFTTNGVKQSILLQAHGQDATLLKGGTVFDKDTLLTAERPYLIYDSITVERDVVVSIAEGASFFMHDKAKWIVKGTITASGTLEKPVTFRGDRLDNLLTDLPYDRMAGLWGGIYFKEESFDNIMEHVVVRNATYGVVFDESTPERSKLKLTNSQLTNSKENLLSAINCNIEAINTEFSNAGRGIVSLFGGEYHFIHCTLVNNFKFSPGRNGQSVLTLSNFIVQEEGEKSFPLTKAAFDNCIIDGSLSEGTESLGGELAVKKNNSGELNYSFNHCAIKTKETDNDGFKSIQFLTKDNAIRYKSIGSDDNNYLFDYRIDVSIDSKGKPKEKQPVIGKADRSVAGKYPVDRMGIDRLAGKDGVDIGAYEYVPDLKEKE
ncbi:MAG: hypothetical protein LBH58_10535 [Tannerellaceae bacterium]|jgi:hypothetical protein|nr:hypothetical protein [Tannerellaceae bacterium]